MSHWEPSSSVIALDPARRRGRVRGGTDRLLGWAVLGFLAGCALVYAALNRDDVMRLSAVWLDRAQELRVPSDAFHFSGPLAICRTRAAPTCVVDGDTIRFNGERIRLSDIDAPELFDPSCDAERLLAVQARDRLAQILSAQAWVMVADGTDRYGRTLARLRLGEEWAGSLLVREGLARRWDGARRSWC